MFELKKKFIHLTLKYPKKQNIVRQLSSCMTKKYNGYQAISTEFARKQTKKFKLIDIIYKPSRNPEKVHFVILLRAFQKFIIIHIVQVIKLNKDLHMNAIIAENSLRQKSNRKSTYKTAQGFLV